MTPGESRPAIRYVMAVLAVGLTACVGCGSRLATVKGQVTLDGRPVDKGAIVMEPADGLGPSAGGPIENGEYRFAGKTGVAPGAKRVRITAFRKSGRKIEEGPPSPPGTMVDEIEPCIPEIYNQKSTLTCEVTLGRVNRHDFHLKSR